MANINQEKFVCVDCETTGLDPKADSIVEIAVVVFSFDSLFDQYETLVDPECAIPPVCIDIHHITNEMVVGKPKIKDVLPKVIELIGDRIIIGHGVQFDIDIITSAAARNQLPCSIQKNKFLDTLRLARLYGDSPSNALGTLGTHFNVPSDGAHRAMSDVMVNIEVFKRLATRYKSIKALFDALSRPILLKKMPLGKHKGRAFRDIPLQYLRWASNKDFDEDLLFSIRHELKQRKEGNYFEKGANPFSNL